MFQLPPPIIKKIWEYDSTYRNIMNICLLELQSATPFWGLRVMFEKEYHVKTIEKKKYNKYFNINKNLAFYWNNDYKKRLTELESSFEIIESKYWTYNEYICDVYPNMHKRIFQNIKNYKHKMYRVDKMNNIERHNFYKSSMGLNIH